MSFSWITVQSVVHMWCCSVGKAKVLVASTFLGMEILLDQITDKRLRYSLAASLQTCCSSWTEFSYYQGIYNGRQCLVFWASQCQILGHFLHLSVIYHVLCWLLRTCPNPRRVQCPQAYSLLSWLLVVPSMLTYGKSLCHPRRASA